MPVRLTDSTDRLEALGTFAGAAVKSMNAMRFAGCRIRTYDLRFTNLREIFWRFVSD
jgi:hypothetical protein